VNSESGDVCRNWRVTESGESDESDSPDPLDESDCANSNEGRRRSVSELDDRENSGESSCSAMLDEIIQVARFHLERNSLGFFSDMEKGPENECRAALRRVFRDSVSCARISMVGDSGELGVNDDIFVGGEMSLRDNGDGVAERPNSG